MPDKDLYKILGVGEKASPNEIKAAYRKLAKKYHPDANPGNKSAEERFKEIATAYEVLSDPRKRKQYDQLRTYGAGGFEGFQTGRGSGGWNFHQKAPGQGFSFEDLGGFGDLGDIFRDLFDQGGASRRSGPGPRRGEDLQSEIEIPFETSISGGKTLINLPLEEICPTCGGSGAEPGSPVSMCPECHGQGFLSFAQGAFSVNRPCPRCYGRGQIISRPCHTCSGHGRVQRMRKIAVTIPAGTADGSHIRLRGQGQSGTGGTPPGDLIITVRIGPHRFFQRRGRDILCQVPINIVQAALGSRIRVRTIDGKIEVKIPPGTQPGTVFRVRGKGLSIGGHRGDQLITVNVVVPKEINQQQRELMEKFAKEGHLPH
jgi:molecular chaperone DnaJ